MALITVLEPQHVPFKVVLDLWPSTDPSCYGSLVQYCSKAVPDPRYCTVLFFEHMARLCSEAVLGHGHCTALKLFWTPGTALLKQLDSWHGLL